MAYWLMKSEPETFSIDDLKSRPKQKEHWDGVRNYQARNMMRDQMQPDDLVFFYHSNCHPPGIVGIAKVASKAYPDHSAQDLQSKYYDPKSTPDNPRWYMVDIQFVEKFPRMISLEEIKQHPELQKMIITRKGSRLSITPVTKEEWQVICGMKTNNPPN